MERKFRFTSVCFRDGDRSWTAHASTFCISTASVALSFKPSACMFARPPFNLSSDLSAIRMLAPDLLSVIHMKQIRKDD